MRHKYRSLFISTIVLFLVINAIPSVLGKTRQYYLTSFILKNEIEGEGFINAVESGASVTYEATAFALVILDNYNIDPHDIETLTGNLEDAVENMFEVGEINLYNLFYLMKSLKILSHDISPGLLNDIHRYLNNTEQITGGFSFSNTSKSPSLASTYYVTQLYSLIEKPINNISTHKNWVMSCYNSDGGYGGNQSLSSTLINTCFAVFILEELGEMDALNTVFTIGYIQSSYVKSSVDLTNYGGYLPDELAQYALLSSTYYCAKAMSLIDDTKLFKATIRNWVLDRQNFIDGGFAENTEGYQQKVSSVVASYYAFETLNILGFLSYLYNEVWMVEFNYWILTIVLGSIGLFIAIVIFLWRRRRI